MMPGPIDVLVVGGGATGAGLLRDLTRRGLRCLLVEKGDMGTGTSGRYHGLLHSGGRYVAKDPLAARECIAENRVLRRIAPGCIEDTGGYFVATPDDPDDYVDAFPAACAAAGVPSEDVPVAELLRREPALNHAIRRAFRVPDASLEPWQLIGANLADARARGSEAWAYHRVVEIERSDGRLLGVTVADVRTGSVTRLVVGFVVSAAGAWAGQVAALAGVDLAMSPGKGTMLVYNQRMTDAVINRCHKPGDGDIMVPVHTVAILGTTELHVDDPDRYEISREEVAGLVAEGAKLFPDLPRMRVLRAYAGVRPLYQETGTPAGSDGRAISRAHAVIDHGARDGVDNLVSIVGGKLTTYRLMAEQTADMVSNKLGVDDPCTTADDVLPGQEPGQTYWLGHRLAEHEQAGGGDADLVCECELVTRSMLEGFLDANWPCSLDDVRRGTRLGMGPCQGGFCAFRAAGIVAQRTADRGGDGDGAPAAGDGAPNDAGAPTAGDGEGAPAPSRELATATLADQAVRDFLRERFKGIRPIASGRQLQELWMVSGIYWGVLGIDSLPPAPASLPGPEEASRDPR